MTVKAVYEEGVLKPKAPLPLKEHEEVEIEVRRTPAAAADDDDPTGWKAIDRLMGSVKSGLKDVSEKHDAYLYGDARD